MDKIETTDIKSNAIAIAKKLMELYWAPLYKYVSQNKQLIKTITGFLFKSENLYFISAKHI